MNYHNILRAVSTRPWAILPEKLDAIVAMLQVRAEGGSMSPELLATLRAQSADLQARASAARASGSGAVAVLPLYGTICHRASLFSDFSGGTSTEQFTQQFRAALNDPSVSALVLDIDSPGGTISGVPELAEEIFQARGQGKKIIGVSNCQADSAAYWIMSACTERVSTPSGEVGSVGVYMVHEDLSEYLAKIGDKITVIKAGKFKAEGNPWEPLSAEALAAMQADVDEAYGDFTGDLARNLRAKVADVRNGFGEGRAVSAKQALKLGMIDRIATLDDVLAELGVAKASRPLRGQASAQCLCTHDDEGKVINPDCPICGRAKAEVIAPTAQADDNAPDPGDAICKCACEACTGVEGCHACKADDCTDPNCGECPAQRDDNAGDDTAAAIERARLSRELAFAALA